MIKKNMTLAAIMMAAIVSGVIATTIPVYAGDGGDSSETNTEQKLKQRNEGDGTNTNCGQNLINSEGIVCFDPTDGAGEDGVPTTCEECFEAAGVDIAVVEAELSAILGGLGICEALDTGLVDAATLTAALTAIGEDVATIDALIDCLTALGILT